MNYATFQHALMYIGIGGLTVAAVVLVIIAVCPYCLAAWDVVRAKRVRTIFLAACVGATIFAGSKHTSSITYPRTDPKVWYLQDAGSGVSNDFIRISFNRNIIVPTTANFFVDGLAHEYTNQSDWASHSFNAYSNTFNNMVVPFDLPFPGAINYNWMCYTDWSQPPGGRTNGVALVAWQIGVGKATNNIAMTRTGVYTNLLIRVAPNTAITNGPAVSAFMSLEDPQ